MICSSRIPLSEILSLSWLIDLPDALLVIQLGPIINLNVSLIFLCRHLASMVLVEI
jgi:hypothetical protein